MRTKISGLILPSQNSEKPTALKGASLSVSRQENGRTQVHFTNHIRSDGNAFKMTCM